jgi:hypothetical protein
MDSILSLALVVVLFYLMMKFGCGAHARGGGCGHSQHHTGKSGEATPDQNSTEIKTR